ncbi:MAG: hypothetical protein Q9187_008340, partial [Circinaria calcarea]
MSYASDMLTEQLCEGWETYPDLKKFHDEVDQDSDFYHRRFNEDSPRLFSTQTDQLESIRVSDNKDVETQSIDSPESLEELLQVNKTSSKEAYYIFRQENSWGRFKATKRSFQKVLTCHAVFFPFLDSLHGFGLKTEEDHKIWDGHHTFVSDRLGEGNDDLQY